MKSKFHKQTIFLASLALQSHGATVNVGPNVTPTNLSTIDEVTFNDNGTIVTQTSSQSTSVNEQRNTPVTLEKIILSNGDVLDNFNFEGARVTLGNLGTAAGLGISGIGVIDSDGTQTALNGPGGAAGFVAAAEATLQDSDINSYFYYDGISSDPDPGTTDFSIQFRYSFQPSDYIVVQERNGNTFFELTPLDINGNPIAGANVLNFGETTGAAFSRYDWNSGFASSNYQSSQEYAFSVTSAAKFFEGTGVTPEPIFGFAVDNDGEADTKFFGVSESVFTDNPIDPSVPEPGSLLLLLLGSASLLGRRR